MTDRPILIIDNPPAAVVVGSGNEYGLLEFDVIATAHELAVRAHALADEGSTVTEMSDAIKGLSDAVVAVTGQLFQLHRAARVGRIATLGPSESA